MNQGSYEIIKSAVPFLESKAARGLARPYLIESLQLALKVIDELKKPKTCEEIASTLAIHPNTVRTVIRALEAGGFPLQRSHIGTIKAVGRPKAVMRAKSEKDPEGSD